MKRAFRIVAEVGLLLALGVFVGCSDDDPASVTPLPDAGSIGVYADSEGNDRNLPDTGGTVMFYVVHKVAEGATASAFRVQLPTGWTLLGSEPQFPVTLGTVTDGLSIGYGECLTGSIHLMTLTLRSPGNSAPGTTFKVAPHTGLPESIQVVDCDNDLLKDAIGEESPVSP